MKSAGKYGRKTAFALTILITAILAGLLLYSTAIVHTNRILATQSAVFVTTFSGTSYTVTFKENGLPPGSAEWSVVLGNTTVTSNGPSISINKSTGSYSWAVSSISSSANILGYVANQTNGSILLTANKNIMINFSPIVINSNPVWQVLGPKDINITNVVGQPDASGARLLLRVLNASGKIPTIVIDPNNSSIMYAGGGNGGGSFGPTSEAGVYKTLNGGKSWTPEDNGLSDPVVDQLWLDSNNVSIVLAGTWTNGIYRSNNSADNWTFVKSAPQITYFLQVNNTLYASWEGGILSSTDVGLQWVAFLSTTNPVLSLAYVKGIFFAGMSNGTVLEKNGTSWKSILTVPGYNVESIAVNGSNPNNIFVVEWNNYRKGNLYITKNGGQTWTNSTPWLGSAAQYVAVSNDNKTLYVGVDGFLFNSSNDGTSYANLSLEADFRYIKNLPGNELLVGSDQGAYLSTNNGIGNSWKSLTGTISSSSLLNGLAVAGSTIITTVQDFSPRYSFDGGATWPGTNFSNNHPPQGENGMPAINPANTSDIYFFTISGFQYRNSTSAQTYAFATGSSRPVYRFQGTDQIIAFSPGNASIIYVVNGSSIEESYNYGKSFFVPWTFWASGNPTLIAVNPYDNHTIYVGNDSGLFVTHDLGSQWSKCGVVSGVPESVAIDPFNTSILLVAANNGMVYKSVNSCSSFVSASSGITLTPNVAPGLLWNINFEPNTQIVALATAHGVYLSLNLGQNWTDVSGNIIPWWVTDLQWSNNYIYVSTYGEGVLKSAASELIKRLYSTTFIANGLPSGTTWSVTYDNSNKNTTTNDMSFDVLSGTYNYNVSTSTVRNGGCVYTYSPSPASGAAATNTSVSISFRASTSCTTTFSASGLPSGTSWSVVYNGTSKSSNASSIKFTTINKTYSYSIGSVTVSGCTYSPNSSSGNLTAGSSIAIKFSTSCTSSGGSSIGFPPPIVSTYTIKFNETGLPAGTAWEVTLGNSTISTTSASISFPNVSSGTRLWTAFTVPCGVYCKYVAALSFGSIDVQASMTVNIYYIKTEYTPVQEQNGTNTNISFHTTISNNKVSLNISALPVSRSIKLYINNSNITLEQLILNTRSYIANPQITIAKYTTISPSLPPIKHVLEYLNISPSFNESTAINNVTYYFMVPNPEISDVGTNFTRVGVYRLNGTNWSLLPTYIVYHNSTITEYKALSPGMSSYVLAETQSTQPKLYYYTTQFIESGLPSNSLWSVRFDNITESNVTPSKILFNTSYGTFGYAAENASMTSHNNTALCVTDYYPVVSGEQNVSAGSIVTVFYSKSITCEPSQSANNLSSLYIILISIVAACAIGLIIYVLFIRRIWLR